VQRRRYNTGIGGRHSERKERMAEELRDIAPLKPLLAARPLAVLSDIDGTLAPIVPDPEDARITGRAHAALARLMERGVRVGLITGRALDKAREMTGLPDASIAANHGLTVCANGAINTPDEVVPYIASARAALAEIGSIAVPGVIIEDKGPIIAFHYRMAGAEDQAVAAIKAAIRGSASAQLFRVQGGRKVIELRPPLAIDKGTAARDMVRAMGAKAVICMGDDATDIDMFRAVGELAKEGVPGAMIAVWSPEADPRLLQAADYSVGGVDGVEWLLEEMLRPIPAWSDSASP